MEVPDISKLRKEVNSNPGGDDGLGGWGWAIVLAVAYVALKKWHAL